jgi:hypothetical protein
MADKLEKIEEEARYENDYNEVPPSDIVAFNELRSCADLFRMYKDGILQIAPEFQRDFVWQGTDQTRFIDSLIKQLPIPSLCFAMDYKAQKWMVIDGLQRISTIVRFLEGGDWRLSKLDDIDPNIAGKTTAAIKNAKDALRKYFTRVENQSLPINVLRCDFDKKNHLEYLFTIFHRLNTGGMKLNNQEIRNCIYGGSFNNLLHALDEYPAWQLINKMGNQKRYRFTKQEIILRFFAFYDWRSKYKGQVAKFLNDYMQEHRNPTQEFLAGKAELFHRTTDFIASKVFRGKPPTKLPVTVLEALLVGAASNIDFVEDLTEARAAARYRTLVDHADFSDAALAEGLSKRPKVNDRMRTAIKMFSSRT